MNFFKTQAPPDQGWVNIPPLADPAEGFERVDLDCTLQDTGDDDWTLTTDYRVNPRDQRSKTVREVVVEVGRSRRFEFVTNVAQDVFSLANPATAALGAGGLVYHWWHYGEETLAQRQQRRMGQIEDEIHQLHELIAEQQRVIIETREELDVVRNHPLSFLTKPLPSIFK
jgi:hypothetical protein